MGPLVVTAAAPKIGMSLGMATVLGLTMVIGTLAPPIFHGTVGALAASHSGWVTFIGIALAIVGVIIVGRAGRTKERELTPEQAKSTIAEFNFKRGLSLLRHWGCRSTALRDTLRKAAATNRSVP